MNVIPLVYSLFLSFTEYSAVRPAAPVWIGFENYAELFQDRLFIQSVLVTLGFVAGSTIPVWILSLLAAILFFQRFPGREFLKTIFYTPVLPQ